MFPQYVVAADAKTFETVSRKSISVVYPAPVTPLTITVRHWLQGRQASSTPAGRAPVAKRSGRRYAAMDAHRGLAPHPGSIRGVTKPILFERIPDGGNCPRYQTCTVGTSSFAKVNEVVDGGDSTPRDLCRRLCRRRGVALGCEQTIHITLRMYRFS